MIFLYKKVILFLYIELEIEFIYKYPNMPYSIIMHLEFHTSVKILIVSIFNIKCYFFHLEFWI